MGEAIVSVKVLVQSPRKMKTMDYAFSIKIMKLIRRSTLPDVSAWVLHREGCCCTGPCLEWPRV